MLSVEMQKNSNLGLGSGGCKMVTTTTNTIEGQRIVKYKKVLVAQSMVGGKMGCKDGEEPKSVQDMTHDEFVMAFGEATSSAFSKIVARAEELGANAIIGASTEYQFCGPNGETLMAIAKGTAVIVDISYY